MMFLYEVDLSIFEEALRYLGAIICGFLYKIVAALFELFINISKVELLSSSDISKIYQRVTLMITIIMIFYVTFETVKYVIQPDTMGDKEKGASKVVSKMIICVVLLAMVPKIFEFSFKLQNTIIENQIIPKLILGPTATSTANSKDMGRTFAASTFALFYGYTDISGEKLLEQCVENPITEEEFMQSLDENNPFYWSTVLDWKKENYKNYGNGIAGANLCSLKNTGTFWHITYELDEDDIRTDIIEKDDNEYIKFDGLMAIIVGGFMVYVLALYCIDLGTRVAQLAFLQIIAPIPIIGYLSPKKDNIFSKWVKQCTTTYIDLFLRMILIYFVLFLCTVIQDARAEGTLFNNISSDSNTTLIYIAIILGLLMFAQKAPKMLQELFPKMGAASGNFGLKAGERVAPLAARGAGMAFGATKAVGAFTRRRIASHNRNKANGKKSILTKTGREQRRQERQNKRNLRSSQELASTSQNLNEKEKNLAAANRKLQLAKKNGNQAEIAAAEKEQAKALKEYQSARQAFNRGSTYSNDRAAHMAAGQKLKAANEELKAAQASGDQNRIARAMMNQQNAKAEFDKINDNMKKYASTTKEGRQETKNKENATETAKNEYEAAKTNLENIKNSGTATADDIVNAQKELDTKKAEYETAQKNYIESGNENSIRQKLSEEEEKKAQQYAEQVAKDSNEKYHSVTADILGSVAGTAHMMHEGLKATKIQDVRKNVNKAEQDDVKRVQAINKYYDDGGAGGISGFVTRHTTENAKRHGYETAYQQTTLQTEAMEPKIKELEARSSLIKDIKTSADGAEDRLKSKIEDLKLGTTGGIKTGLKDANGNDITTTAADGNTLGDVYRTYKGRAESAKAESDSAAAALQKFETEKADILSKDPNTLAGQDLIDYNKAKTERDALAKTKEEKSKISANAAYAVTQVQKNAARYEYSKILQEFASGKTAAQISALGIYDGPAVEQIADARESITVARSNPVIVEKLRTSLSTTNFDQFMSGNILEFDVLDEIKNKALSAQAEYDREARALKEQKRSIETSRETKAQKAANDYNGGGNK